MCNLYRMNKPIDKVGACLKRSRRSARTLPERSTPATPV